MDVLDIGWNEEQGVVSFRNSLVSSRSKTPTDKHFCFLKKVGVYIHIFDNCVFSNLSSELCPTEYKVL